MTKQDNGLLGRETIAECIYVKKENKSCKCKYFCLSEINSNKDEEKKKRKKHEFTSQVVLLRSDFQGQTNEIATFHIFHFHQTLYKHDHCKTRMSISVCLL